LKNNTLYLEFYSSRPHHYISLSRSRAPRLLFFAKATAWQAVALAKAVTPKPRHRPTTKATKYKDKIFRLCCFV